MEHSETRDFPHGGSEIVQEASPLVSCFWCERLHPGEHPLAPKAATRASPTATRALPTPPTRRSGATTMPSAAATGSTTRPSPSRRPPSELRHRATGCRRSPSVRIHIFLKRSPRRSRGSIESMNAHVSLSGPDSAFLSLETPSTPMSLARPHVAEAHEVKASSGVLRPTKDLPPEGRGPEGRGLAKDQPEF
jgi:hypothetical protein